ncbi:class I SAM-dependent methyltransferase [Candidatus Parcubacteria bacterium]|nr:class I SAM-dependent methyltransferase [Candidatus Parcubacteria bacterium]
MAFLDPRMTLSPLGLSSGMKVADVGAGSGAYALAAAEAVGDSGVIYAIDVQKELLGKLKREAERRGKHSIHIVWANAEVLGGSGLNDQSVDAAIFSNVLFQMEDKEEALREVRRILVPKGRVLVIDWSESGGLGPQKGHLFGKAAARALFEGNGFTFRTESRAGDHHYALVFQKS